MRIASLLAGNASDPGRTGAVFTLDPASGIERVLHVFNDTPTGYVRGYVPVEGLTNIPNTLYGTTVRGGITRGGPGGVVFKMSATSGHETVLYEFPDQGYPLGALTDYKTALYGTTVFGGSSNYDTVYKVDPKSRAATVLHSFGGGADGAGPEATLLVVGRLLYGTTSSGGNHNSGTLFQINPASGIYRVLFSFDSLVNGSNPRGDLVSLNGSIFGTTASGKNSLYQFDTSTKVLTVLHFFGLGEDGGVPNGGVLLNSGMLVGTTTAGGASNKGSVSG